MENFLFKKADSSQITQLSALAHELNLFHGFDMAPNAKKLAADWDKMEVYVALSQDGDIAGFIQGYPTYQLHDAVSGYEIQNLYVPQKWRRQKIGFYLTYNLITKKTQEGTEKFSLTVLKNNDSAANFYRSCGFELKDGNILYFGKLTGEKLKAFLERNSDARVQ